MADLVGNQGVINDLIEWLKDWDKVILQGMKKEIKFRKGVRWED